MDNGGNGGKIPISSTGDSSGSAQGPWRRSLSKAFGYGMQKREIGKKPDGILPCLEYSGLSNTVCLSSQFGITRRRKRPLRGVVRRTCTCPQAYQCSLASSRQYSDVCMYMVSPSPNGLRAVVGAFTCARALVHWHNQETYITSISPGPSNKDNFYASPCDDEDDQEVASNLSKNAAPSLLAWRFLNLDFTSVSRTRLDKSSHVLNNVG